MRRSMLLVCIIVFCHGSVVFAEGMGCLMPNQIADHLSSIYQLNIGDMVARLGTIHPIASINFEYGMGRLRKNIGKASIMMQEKEEGHYQLSISGSIKALGQKLDIALTLDQEQLKNGEAAAFYLPGADDSFLEIIPDSGFDQHGGNITIWHKDDDGGWHKTLLRVQRVGDEFKLLQRRADYFPVIKEIDVALSGTSIDDVAIDDITLR